MLRSGGLQALLAAWQWLDVCDASFSTMAQPRRQQQRRQQQQQQQQQQQRRRRHQLARMRTVTMSEGKKKVMPSLISVDTVQLIIYIYIYTYMHTYIYQARYGQYGSRCCSFAGCCHRFGHFHLFRK